LQARKTDSNFQAVIFDMDGVIVDSEPRHAQAFLEIFHEMGCADTHGIDFDDYYGRSDRALWEDFIARHKPTQAIEELVQWKQGRLIDLLVKDEPIFAELPGLLKKLAMRYRLAVASGSAHVVIDQVLAMQQLRRFFPVVVSSQDVTRGKPAPDIFLRAAELMGVPPSSCWVIEDAETGVQGALAAGMRVIAITNTLPAERLADATFVVGTYAEIETLLLPNER